MSHKVRWGILGVSKFAMSKSAPALCRGSAGEVRAVASRDAARARAAADQLGVPIAYGSYEELLADPEIDAIYNPLPNHMHVPWSIRAAEAGKHVLCEKPLGLSASEVRQLIAVRDRKGVRIGEAFMVRVHPQWIRAKEIVNSGELGELRAVTGHFSYFNRDPRNIRNRLDVGGGALLDIGCYPIFVARFLFGAEPRRVAGLLERDPEMRTDRLTSALLEFPGGQCAFTCSTQLVPHQRIQVLGAKGRVELEIPFNAPPDRPTRLSVDLGGALDGSQIRVETFAVADQYVLQADAFSGAVLGEMEVPVTLENSLGNMQSIEALFRSAESGRWENPADF
ncbi:MAG: Gfo/Idh/MocA family oxidoreductase [Acidobacteriia bacterium]|nr:Gfo/Idh/MocA family oxidoreductase [Terriglobia bacterium]